MAYTEEVRFEPEFASYVVVVWQRPWGGEREDGHWHPDASSVSNTYSGAIKAFIDSRFNWTKNTWRREQRAGNVRVAKITAVEFVT